VRVLVTGASGFVGGFLAPRLRAGGWDVVGCDQEVDVTDATAVARHVAKVSPDAIIHLAAQSSVALSWQNPALTYRVNFLGSRSILEAAADKTPDARVMLVGSADQYGSSEPGAPPLDESAPLRPRSPYARTKAAADRLGAEFAEAGLDVLRIRAFNHSGPGQSDTFVMSSWARQAAEIASGQRAPELRVGNLDSVRDFLDVEDVVDAYARLLDTSVPAGAYNVASGRGVRLRELLDQLLELAGIQPNVEVDPERFRPLDVSIGNSDRLRLTTGWEPRIPLARSLERLLDYWRDAVSAT